LRTPKWDRQGVITRLRRDLWKFITEAASTDDEVLLFAASLLQMSTADVRVLAQLQFVLSDPVGRLLREMPFLSRRLTTATVSELETSAERLRGPIRWGETLAMRSATGVPHIYVTAPTRRAYDTPENQVLTFALGAIVRTGDQTGWQAGSASGPAEVIRKRVNDATRWTQLRALADVDTTKPTDREAMQVRSGRASRRYAAALDVFELYKALVARVDRNAVRDAVEQNALLARKNSVLFELECLLDTIALLRTEGWGDPQPGLIRPPLVYAGQRDGLHLALYYQHQPRELATGSRYRQAQIEHEFQRAGPLLPDLVLKLSIPGRVRWLLIEVKWGETRTVEKSARAALLDLLGYRRAFEQTLAKQPFYGIGYAWGTDLSHSEDGEIMLSSPDRYAEALDAAINRLEGQLATQKQ
jgi:hypothetical protein